MVLTFCLSLRKGLLLQKVVKVQCHIVPCTEVVISNFKVPVPLYCVPSIHNSFVDYEWELIGKDVKFPSSPVVTVGMAGLYKCMIACPGFTPVESQLIWVTINLRQRIGIHYCAVICIPVVCSICLASYCLQNLLPYLVDQVV